MRWKNRRRSGNVRDRRGGGAGLAGGGIGGLLLLVLFTFLSGGDVGDLFNGEQPPTGNQTATYEETEEEAELYDYVSVILADTEDIWSELFNEYGYEYEEPALVIYSGTVQSACGISGASTGPFYCPGDRQLYIDLSFYDDLRNQYNAPGDFAMAYVVAHEVGHHVQTLLGVTEEVMPLREQMSETEFNRYLVSFELQADYLAGVWAHHAEELGYLEEGDYEEAINAASAVGDDRLQQQAQGYVVPESFTHGTSEQRMHWFERGFQSGNLENGDTFNRTDF